MRVIEHNGRRTQVHVDVWGYGGLGVLFLFSRYTVALEIRILKLVYVHLWWGWAA